MSKVQSHLSSFDQCIKNIITVEDFEKKLEYYPANFYETLSNYLKNQEMEPIIGSGVYLKKILENFFKKPIKELERYPSILYAETHLKDTREYYEGIVFSDIVFPSWKYDLPWYSQESYHATMEALTSKVLGTNHYFTQLISLLHYNLIEQTAHYAFHITIEGKIPKKYH